MDKIRVLVVDDMEIIRKGYEILLSKIFRLEVCGMAADSDAAVQMTQELDPDIILMDIMLPDKDGVKTCKEMLNTDSRAKVLLNTSHISEETINNVVFSGAKGLLLKDADCTEIEKAMDTVYNGGEFFCKKACDMMIQRFLKTNKDSYSEFWRKEFSDRELDIIKLTSMEMTAKEIGDKLHMSQRTVEVSRNTLLKKMKVSSTIAMVVRAYKIGLIDANA